MGDELIDMHNRIGVANSFLIYQYPDYFSVLVPGGHKMSHMPSYNDEE